MAATEPAEITRAWFERVWNQGDESAIEELFAPTGIAHGLAVQGDGLIKGPGAFKAFAQGFKSAFPDMKISITRCLVEGDYCAVHCDVSGTHTGDGLGIAPTGRAVRFSGITITRVSEGQIQEGWNSYDFLGLYQQLGLIPKQLT
jgi:predicted ester cyclase